MREHLIVITKENGEKGLKADKDFKAGEIVLELEGEITSYPTRHSIEVGQNEHLSDRDVGRCLNHSCNPNTKIDQQKRTVYAIKDIAKGDELNFDYNENETEMATPFKCQCGVVEKCQGFIGGRKSKNNLP